MCGGMNELREGETSRECTYCGMLTTFPRIDTEQREQLYNRAEHFRQANNFDKAANVYAAILDLDGEDPEAWWGQLISKYGIEYVEDPANHERIPTCHRVQFDSILADPDYRNALKYASETDRSIYEKRSAPHRGDTEEYPQDIFAGGALRRLHLLQRSRKRRTHEGFPASAGHLLSAHEQGIEGLFLAHYIGR